MTLVADGAGVKVGSGELANVGDVDGLGYI
jgi:hypothetical protein